MRKEEGREDDGERRGRQWREREEEEKRLTSEVKGKNIGREG